MKTMIDKHIAYWSNSAAEDWEVGSTLIRDNKIRHGLFLIHLALEKVLKAHFCQSQNAMAPKIHSLIRLAEKAKLDLNEEELDFLSEFDRFDIAGRYPDHLTPIPTRPDAMNKMARAGELYQWLLNQL